MAGNLLGMLELGLLGKAREGFGYIVAPVLEEVPGLSAHGDHFRTGLIQNGLESFLAGVAGICTSQALVSCHHQHQAVSLLMAFQQRMGELSAHGHSNPLHHLRHLFRIGTVSLGCLFGMAHTGSCHHVHGVGDLLDALDTLGAALDVL